MMTTKTSHVQAKYAATVLRIAESSDKDAAIRLLQGLVGDPPAHDATQGQAQLHLAAIESYLVLVAVLREEKFGVAPPWGAAYAATERWLAMT